MMDPTNPFTKPSTAAPRQGTHSNSHLGAHIRRMQELLIIGAMPFLYGAATRLPFIYYVIHLDFYFTDITFFEIGLYVSAYQGSRVITSIFSIFMPRISHFVGTCIGVAGYFTVYFADNSLLTPFAVGTAVIGFSETMSSMQKYTKELYKFHPDRKKTNLMLKYQYHLVMLGVMFAFSIGGFVYQYQGIDGVALFGGIIEALALLCFFIFIIFEIMLPIGTEFVLHSGSGTPIDTPLSESAIEPAATTGTDKAQQTTINFANDKEDDEDDEGEEGDSFSIDKMPVSSTHSLNGGMTHSQRQLAQLSGSQQLLVHDKKRINSLVESVNTSYTTNMEISATWVNWIICVSFGIEALTIGYNLSIGPIFVLNQFNKGTGWIGILFAVGAASGTIAAIFVTGTKTGANLMKSIASKPFDLIFAMFGIAVGVLVAAIPYFSVHVIGLVLLMCFNDLGATLMTELQGSITTANNYALLGPMGQVVRRTLNCVTALTGPILFGVFPRLPYFVAGGITLLWTSILYMLFINRRIKTLEKIAAKTGQNRELLWNHMSFATAEVVNSMLPVVDKNGNAQPAQPLMNPYNGKEPTKYYDPYSPSSYSDVVDV